MPALDAVIFLSPRKSMVDVVQTVGRVMRRAPNKVRGYVVIPVVVPKGKDPSAVLDNNKDFKVVWQVLRALKSIDPNFGSVIDGQLGKIDPSKIGIICVNNNAFMPKDPNKKKSGKKKSSRKNKNNQANPDDSYQAGLDMWQDGVLEDAIETMLIKHLGNRREWQDWAAEVGNICQEQAEQINAIIKNPDAVAKFSEFKTEFRAILNENISDNDVIEMLAQHIVIAPVMDALFTSHDFTTHNPIARAMTKMVKELDNQGLLTANALLDGFYDSVRVRMKNVTTPDERQVVIVDLFDKFFKIAFPKMQEKLGIVFTPIEVVDFINNSVNDLLKSQFGMSLADSNVHLLDPFTGTGTFITRLIQSENLLPDDKLTYKYEHELHAFEIVPLSYYIAAVNIESAYHERKPDIPYQPNQIAVLTDTFASHKNVLPFVTELEQTNAKRKEVDALDIRVIVGNPPYSVGQKSQNDNNQNEHYEDLENRIVETYVAKSSATLKNSLYDSYKKALRWASDRIGDRGLVAFVTNASWIRGAADAGVRLCVAEEFNDIYLYDLKGNQRTSGEQSKREGGKIFDSGSRAPIAIVILVKNPDNNSKGIVHYACVDDYLTRAEKLHLISEIGSFSNLPTKILSMDKYGDWLNHRRTEYSNFINIGDKKLNDISIFINYSRGITTSRDPWSYNSSISAINKNFDLCISTYNQEVDLAQKLGKSYQINTDKTKIKWDRPQKRDVIKGKKASPFNAAHVYTSFYRPFFKQYLYFDRYWNNCVYQMPNLFPEVNSSNLVITFYQGIKDDCFLALMTNAIPDIHFNGDSQCFPRYIYQNNELAKGQQDLFTQVEPYTRVDAISRQAIDHFKAVYPESEAASIDADSVFYYIYGILHSEDYRKTYADNLSRELPRIPRVKTYAQFKAFEEAGRKLADLHVNYERQPKYAGCVIDAPQNPRYEVAQMKYGKIPGKVGNAAKDKTVIIYNSDIIIRNVPLEAQEYVVNKKSALDWILERYCVSVDKESGIVNDSNDYADSLHQPTYIFDLVLKIITVSLETMKIVKALPKLEIHPLDLANKQQ